MSTSKELAHKAVGTLKDMHANGRPMTQEEADFLITFAEAASRKLPTEAAIDRDRNRVRKPATV